MFIVVITGGIKSGKTTVANVFREQGIPVVDSEKIAEDVVAPGERAHAEIKELFGNGVLLENDLINRNALGKATSGDDQKRMRLNRITYPRIHKQIYREIIKHFLSGERFIVLDSPLFFETGFLMDFVYKIITVSCEPEQQYERLMASKMYSIDEVQRRVTNQMPLLEKCAQSHFVVDNSGDIEETLENARKICLMLQNNNHYLRIRCKILVVFLIIAAIIYFLRFM